MLINQKNKIIIASLAFLIVGVLLFSRSGWIMLTARPVPSAVTQYPMPVPPGPIASNVPIISPGPTPDMRTWREVLQSPVINPEIKWKTYRNNTYGFEIQYPSDWTYGIRYWQNEPVIEFFYLKIHPDMDSRQFALQIQERSREEYEKTRFPSDAFGKVPKKETILINGVDCALVNPDLGVRDVILEFYCARHGYIFSFGEDSTLVVHNHDDISAYMINTFRFIK